MARRRRCYTQAHDFFWATLRPANPFSGLSHAEQNPLLPKKMNYSFSGQPDQWPCPALEFEPNGCRRSNFLRRRLIAGRTRPRDGQNRIYFAVAAARFMSGTHIPLKVFMWVRPAVRRFSAYSILWTTRRFVHITIFHGEYFPLPHYPLTYCWQA